LVLGVGLFGLSYAGFGAGPASVLVLAPWFVAAGVAIGCVETAEYAAVVALTPVELRGRPSGCWPRCRASATWPPAPSPASCLLWTAASPRVAFGYLVIWMLLALLGLVAARRSSTRPTALIYDSAPIWWSPIVLTYRPTDIYPIGDT
jgi:hypothetical protein